AAGARVPARHIARVDRCRIQPDRFLRGERKLRGEREENYDRFHFDVTLSGSGRHLSIFEYHGIRKKNRKYTAVPTCAASVRPSVTDSVPRYPSTKNTITKRLSAVLVIGPLYRIDLTGLRSSQGRKKKIITEVAINTTPQTFASKFRRQASNTIEITPTAILAVLLFMLQTSRCAYEIQP